MTSETKSIQDLLNEYSYEIYGNKNSRSILTIEKLIDSHRRLREFSKRSQTEKIKEMQDARVAGQKEGREAVTHGEYIEVETLRKMSVAQVVDFLAEGS